VHELGLCEGIVEAVERRAAGRRVTGVRVRVGALHRVSGPAFDQAFSMVSMGTVAEDAEVDLVVVPVGIACRACGRLSESEDAHAACPGCGSPDVEVSGGDELTLESIRVDAPVEGRVQGEERADVSRNPG
jgi:hydrogenase nickel incorporation protein HypA/HybF